MGRIGKFLIPGVDKRLLVKEAAQIMPDPARRRFIAGGASLGALTLLTGCDVLDSSSAEEMLRRISKFNDAVQAWMFNPDVLAPTFPESAITKPFPFNGYYELDDAPEIDGKDWKFEVKGLVEKPPVERAPSNKIVSGRYILQPEVMRTLEGQEKGAGGEIQLTDAMARMIGRQPFHAVTFDGRRFDCGNKTGFVEATLALALERPDIGAEVRAMAERLLAR